MSCNSLAEQYAYMCDLKRTLDATVCLVDMSGMPCAESLGPLRAGDALGDRKDSISLVPHRVLPTGMSPHVRRRATLIL